MKLILLAFALVCFVLGTFNVGNPKANLVSAGLAFLTASFIFPN